MIKDFFTKNIPLKLLSVLFSCMLWFLVVTVEDPVVTKVYGQIPVQLINAEQIMAQGKVYEVVNGTDNVSVAVRAKRTIVDHLSKDDFYAVADVAMIRDGKVTIDVRAEKLADKIESIVPKNRSFVELIVENKVEKQLEIEVMPIGNVAEGYMIGSLIPKRKTVRISGPESVVDRVSASRVNVDVEGLTGNMSTNSEIMLVDEIGSAVSDDRVTLSFEEVGVEVKIFEMLEISLDCGYTGTPMEGFVVASEPTCVPNKMVVAGELDIVKEITNLSIPNNVLDVSNAVADTEVQISIKDYLPRGVIVADENEMVTLSVAIEPLQTRLFEVPTSNIAVINTPEGVNATIGGLGEVVAVEVMGLADDLDDLNPAMITGVVDCQEVELPADGGQFVGDGYDTKIKFNYPDGIYDSGTQPMCKLILQYVAIE